MLKYCSDTMFGTVLKSGMGDTVSGGQGSGRQNGGRTNQETQGTDQGGKTRTRLQKGPIYKGADRYIYAFSSGRSGRQDCGWLRISTGACGGVENSRKF